MCKLLRPIARKQSCTTGRRTGRQAEIRPADISIDVQPTVGARVYVGSCVSYVNKTRNLYADANTTLDTGQRQRVLEHRQTYKKPKLNVRVKAIFSNFLNCSFQSSRSGSNRMMTSVRIVEAAFAIHVPT